MVDRKPQLSSSAKSTKTSETPEQEKTEAILSTQTDGYQTMKLNPEDPRREGSDSLESHDTRCSSSNEVQTPSQGFYRTLLFDLRILAGLANTMGQSVIVAGFDTTLPLLSPEHVPLG